LYLSRKRLESVAIAGDSPVCGKGRLTIRYLSRARHVKASLNLRGPSRKAKYSLVLVELTPETITMVGTDGRRLAKMTAPAAGLDGTTNSG